MTAENPWHTHITIDLLAHVLARSLFHPYIAWLIPLCLRSLSYPTSHPHFQYTCLYAAFITVLAVLRKADKRLAWGRPRKMDWEREVVVITGGASGLGKVLAEMYGMRGVSVAVLDVRVPEERERSEALEHVRFYRCDVSRLEDVQRAKGEVERDVRRSLLVLISSWKELHGFSIKKTQNSHSHSLFISSRLVSSNPIQSSPPLTKIPQRTRTNPSTPQLGPPTILINNAGTVAGQPLLSLTPQQINRTLTTNLHSHFHTLQTFLPSLLASPQGGTIVTVASVLGKLGAANLTDYAAAKAGLIAMHASLRAELADGKTARGGSENVRTVLVTPGQLGTSLFAGVATPSAFLGPVVEAVELARAIVRVVDAGESGEISLPLYAGWVGVLECLPFSLKRFARWASGVDGAMGGFVGGGKKEG